MIHKQWLNSSGETLDTVLKKNSDSDTRIKGNRFFLIAINSLPYFCLSPSYPAFFHVFLLSNNQDNNHDNNSLTLY